MSENTPLVVVGGNSIAGSCLIRRMAAQGLTAHVLSRRPLDLPTGFTKVTTDLYQASDWVLPKGAIIISLLPLWILAAFLPRLTGARAVIALGSTSRFSKAHSLDTNERATATKLAEAEQALEAWAQLNHISWTILRPTIIYDGHSDKNIARMAAFIRRWGFLPIGSPARGLRQPIHSDDIALALVKCVNNARVANRAFNIAGGEILTYRAMAERVFTSLGQKPRFFPLSPTLMRALFSLASRLKLINESSFGGTIFLRMNEDLIFDTDEGLQALNYHPRIFAPDVNIHSTQ